MRAFTTITVLSLAACGGGSTTSKPDAQDIGFELPTDVLHANMQGSAGPTDLGPADLSCYQTASTDTATTVQVTLMATVKDFQNQTPVPNAMVTAFQTIDYQHPFDTQTSDSSTGDVTVTVPVGTVRFGFQMTTTDGKTMPTFLLNQYIDPNMASQNLGKIQSVSTGTAELLPALIGETRMTGTGVVAGALRDCSMHEISNFVATVSSSEGTATPIAGAEAYYFQFAGGMDLPTHHMGQESASGDGLFMVIQLPAAPTAYVQMWGFPTAADLASGQLKLVSELQVPVVADTVVTGSFELLRSQ